MKAKTATDIFEQNWQRTVLTDLLLLSDTGVVSGCTSLLQILHKLDIVDHKPQHASMECGNGNVGTLLNWFRSHVGHGVYWVGYGYGISTVVNCKCTVLQGTVLI
jgi:hypothetical protein